MKGPKQRTLKQNSANHLWYKHAADALNGAGVDMQVFLKKRAGIYWTPEAFKETVFKVLAKAMFQVDSTTKLTTKQNSQVVEALIDFIARDYGVHIPYPSQETLEHERAEEMYKWRAK